MNAPDKLNPKRVKKLLQSKSAKRRSRNSADVAVASAEHGPRRNDLQPTMPLVVKPIGDLKPGPHRATVGTPEMRESLQRSILRFGILLPPLIDKDDQIIAGHELWQAAGRAGLTTIECRVVEHLSPLECEAAALALRRIGELGTYDLETLRDRMIVIRSAGIELSTTGFKIEEIDQILLSPTPATAADEEIEDTGEQDTPIVEVGDLFQLDRHRLLCGDSLELESYERVLDGKKAAAVFSDPPYGCVIENFVSGLGQNKHEDFVMGCNIAGPELSSFLGSYLSHCKASAAPGAVIFACMDWREIDTLLVAGRAAELTRINVAVWSKGSGGMGGLYRSAHEFVAVFCNGKTPAINNVGLGVHGRDRTNVWGYAGANRPGSSAAKALADHPTPKPIELVEDALLDVTHPDDLVLDPFMGSGTTLIAAKRCGRISHGIELDPKYVARTIRRWEALTGKQAIHCETGLTMAELGVQRAQAIEN